MTFIQTLGQVQGVSAPWTAGMSYGSLRLYDRYAYDYATLYKTQPNIRTCVDFLARNIAQLGLHVFQRMGETDRRRLRDHPLAQLIEKPLPPEYKVTRYRLIESLVSDLGVYFNGFWIKARGGENLGLLRVPPPWMLVYGNLMPLRYELGVPGTAPRFLQPAEVVHFRGYNPEDAARGLSPLETLRRVLAEEFAMGEYRESYWRNSARMAGIIERPKDAPEWSDPARLRFKAEFEALYSGGQNSGKTAILEEGMTWRAGTFDAQQSEYLGGRKLTREECARAYHIPLPMVGILDNATFSNIREQHKNLYQDCLGPWLAMLEGDIETQLLTEFPEPQGVYVEFNIQEKLQGSFEEQMEALNTGVGRPWMTANEARARMNLPRLPDGDELALPLNVTVGTGSQQAADAPDATSGGQARRLGSGTKGRTLDVTLPKLRARHEQKWAGVMGGYFDRQQQAILPRVPESGGTIAGVWSDGGRWDRELTTDMFKMSMLTAMAWAQEAGAALDAEVTEDEIAAWVTANATAAAKNINQATRDELKARLTEEDAEEPDAGPRDRVRKLFEVYIGARALQIATSRVTTLAAFGSHEGARKGGLTTKTWHVNSGNPRPDHAAMNGETVGIEENFSNGMLWPGDPAGGADNNAGCQCSVTFGRD